MKNTILEQNRVPEAIFGQKIFGRALRAGGLNFLGVWYAVFNWGEIPLMNEIRYLGVAAG